MSRTSHENGPNADHSKICEDMKIFDRVLPETAKIHDIGIATKKRLLDIVEVSEAEY